MPITLQEYRAKQQQISFAAINLPRILAPIKDKIDHLQGESLEAKNAKDLVNKIYASNGLMISTSANTDEETFNRGVEGLDLLPKLLNLEVPGEPGRTMQDVLMEGKSEEERVKITQNIFAYGQLVGIPAYIPESMDQKKQAEKAGHQVKEAAQNLKEEELYKANRNRSIPEFGKEDLTGEKRTAAEWIDDLREFGGVTEQNVAEIMAARLLANSVRGVKLSKTGLQDTELTRTQIIKTAGMLKNSTAFKTFWKENEKGIKDAYGKGHGGGLDDLFKESIRTTPAGTLPTEGIYSRYMPTVLERIDALKDQIKQDYNAETAAAEIVILRNMIGAEKGQKNTLNKKLTIEQMNELNGQVHALARDPAFKNMLKDQKIQSLMKKGHGGDMLERMRKLQKNYPDMDPNTKSLMNGTTIGHHIANVRQTAANIAQDIRAELNKVQNVPGKRNMEPVYAQIEKANKALAEYLALDNQARKSGNREDGLLQDVPTEKINEQVNNRNKNEVFNHITKNLSPDKAITIMKSVSEKEPDEFMRSLSEENLGAILPEEKNEVREYEKGNNLEGPAMIINNF